MTGSPKLLDQVRNLIQLKHLSYKTEGAYIGCFRKGESEPTYYSQESVGIAVGLLLAALHNMGLATLTHTPSPMKFLQEILGRPRSEVPFVLIPVGYPAEDARVPDIKRKPLEEIMTIV